MLLPLAKCGQPIDAETASRLLAYAELWPKESDKDPDVAKLKDMGIKPLVFDGHMPLNYACAGIQRRGDWMLLVRGQKKGFLANEAYAMDGSNTMGRFVNYGHVLFQSPDTLNFHFLSGPSGKGVQGWNWALWPGTTTRLLPHDALRGRFEVDEAITSEPFCGDTSLDGNGAWGMKLQEEIPGSLAVNIGPVKYWLGEKLYAQLIKDGHYDKDFRARKSVFMFDDRVVCLGSGIKSSDEYPAVTTLFQNSLDKDGLKERFKVSGSTAAVFPIETEMKGGCWLIDSNNIGYCVPSGNDALRIERKLQKLPFHLFWTFHNPENQAKGIANEGETEFAYLNHGVRPSDGGYEYAMLIKATPERMEAFAKKSDRSDPSDQTDPTDRPYKVLRRDSTAHIVKDSASKTTGYVIFEAEDLGLETGNSKLDKSETGKAAIQEARTSNQASSNQFPVSSFILSTSAPCVVMVKDAGDGKLKLSFCNPDLGNGGGRGESNEAEQVASLTLKDTWKIVGESKEARATEKSAATTIEFRTFGARPVELELVSGK